MCSWAARIGVLLAGVLLTSLGLGDTLQYGDGQADGKRSIGGGGHLTMFDAGAEGRWLNRIEMFGSRYGTATPPDEDFHLYIVDADRQVLRQVSLPYLLWDRGEDYWRTLPIPPIQVPQQFGIGLTFNAEQTKGVYVGTDNVGAGHSFSWLPGTPGKAVEGLDWMIAATVEDQPDGDPEARDLVVLQDGNAFFERVVGAEGDPLTISTVIHGQLEAEQVASIRFGAITGSPGETNATIVLLSGARIDCKVLSADENGVRIQDAGGAERALPRADIARIDFR